MPHIKKATAEDITVLQSLSDAMGHVQEPEYFARTLGMDDRAVFILEDSCDPVGYVILNEAPRYAYFKMENIPEIQDLSVLPQSRGQGFGRFLMAHCEVIAQDKGYTHMGLGVGLHARFGAAQRLYAKLGYVPDGFGVTYDRESVAAGSFKPVDDHLCIMMVKTL